MRTNLIIGYALIVICAVILTKAAQHYLPIKWLKQQGALLTDCGDPTPTDDDWNSES